MVHRQGRHHSAIASRLATVYRDLFGILPEYYKILLLAATLNSLTRPFS
jgi:hypothetical protein